MPTPPNPLDRMKISPDLQAEFERQKSQSFLQNSKELRDREREDFARADAILSDYARRHELSNNILGLIPTPRPHMPSKFNPAALAVVPGALKYLRKRAAENQKKFNPPKEIPEVKTHVESVQYGKRNTLDKTADVFAKGVPIATIYPSPKKSNFVSLGDSKVKSKKIRELFEDYVDNTREHYPKEYAERNALFDAFYEKYGDGALSKRKNTTQVDIDSADLSKYFQGSKFDEKNRAGTGLPSNAREAFRNVLTAKSGIKNRNKKAGGLGPREVAGMLPIIKSFYPETESASGYRISGTRAKYKADPYQEIPLPNLLESEMQKYRSAARKPLHREISERPNRNLIKELIERSKDMKAENARLRNLTTNVRVEPYTPGYWDPHGNGEWVPYED